MSAYRIFTGLILPVILIAFGVIFVMDGFIVLEKRNTFYETTAVISQIQTEGAGIDPEDVNHRVIVNYMVDGKHYTAELDEYHSGMHEGDQVDILYDPDNPKKIISAGIFSLILFFVGGSVLLLIGLLMILKTFIPLIAAAFMQKSSKTDTYSVGE